MSVCCPAVLLSLLSGFYRVLTRITCTQPLSRCWLTLLASSFFSENVVVVFSLFYPSFSPCVLSFSSLAYWPFRTHKRALICNTFSQFSHRIISERSRVRIPVRAAGEFSFPGSTFCTDIYFCISSTSVLPQQHVKYPGHSAKSPNAMLQLNTHAPYVCGFA